MSTASEDCTSDQHPFASEVLETKAVVAMGEGSLGDVDVQGEVASDAKTPAESTGMEDDEIVQEQCGLSDPVETPVQGVRTEASEEELYQEVEGFFTENDTAEGVEGRETKEAACGDEGTEKAPAEALGEEPIENSWPYGATDTAPDAKTIIQAKVSDEQELMKPPDYQEEKIKIPKEEAMEESEYDVDQKKENKPPIGIEDKDNAVVEDVERENIVSDTPQVEGEADGENGVKEQIKEGRAGAEPEPEEKLIVENAANEIIAAKETERVAALMVGTGNDDLIQDTILTREPPNASEVVAMDRATEAAEDGPIWAVGVEQKEKLETDTLTFERMQAPEFEARASLKKEGIEAKASKKGDDQVLAEKIVREIDEGKVEITLNARNEVIEAEKRDSTKKPSGTTLVLNGEGNDRKEQGNGKQSWKLMSRVKSSLGKVRKAIVGRPSPSLKTIVVNARLEEKVQ